MRTLAALLLLTSCGGMRAAELLTPDEFTIGHGIGEQSGIVSRDNPIAGYEGESQSTYAALTWSLPSFKDEDRLTRDERNAIREHNFKRAGEPEAQADAEGASPPLWLPVAVFGILLIGFLGFWATNRRKNLWR